MKLSPMPRTRMKVSVPRFTFLSCAIRSISASASEPSRRRNRKSCVGRPTAAQMALDALGLGLRASGRAARKTANASTMPIATASPCSRRSEKPAAASSAWPKVWPRLSSARSPVSRSSRATIAALARQLTAMRVLARRGRRRTRRCQLASSQAKKSASPSSPYFTTSA